MVNINVFPNMDSLGQLGQIMRIIGSLTIDHRPHVVLTLILQLIARMPVVRNGRKRIDEIPDPVPRLAAAKKQVRRAGRFLRRWTRTGGFAGEQITESGEARNNDCWTHDVIYGNSEAGSQKPPTNGSLDRAPHVQP